MYKSSILSILLYSIIPSSSAAAFDPLSAPKLPAAPYGSSSKTPDFSSFGTLDTFGTDAYDLLNYAGVSGSNPNNIGPPGPPGKDGKPGPPGPPGICSCDNNNNKNVPITKGYASDEVGKPKALSGDAYGNIKGYSPQIPKNIGISNLISKTPKHDKSEKIEDKKFAKKADNSKLNDLVYETEIEKKNKGYNDELAYQGAEIFEDAAIAQQGYVKGEDYISEGDEETRKDSLYGGDSIYQTDDISTNAKVAFEIDHSSSMRDNYNDENHRGSYTGDEFDVAYKSSDIVGGYSNTELDREKKNAGYSGYDAKGQYNKGGKYYGDDYDKYGKDEKDLYYKDRQFGDVNYDPKGLDNGYGNPNTNNGDLYSKFRGDSKGGLGDGFGNGNKGINSAGKAYYPYGERLRVNEDREKDDKYRGYGANYEGNDYFGDKKEQEAYSGASQKEREKIAFDKGNYRDVAASGKNKAASYAGDYQTNKKSHDVDYKVKHFEDLQQDLKQDIKSDQYYAKYEGEDNKYARNADKKHGKYQDKEFKKKQDAIINGKKYNGNDYSNRDETDIDAYAYLNAKDKKANKQELKAKPYGYRPNKRYDDDDSRPVRYDQYRPRSKDAKREERYPYGYGGKKNDYGYYNGGYRRMLMNNELEQIRSEMKSFQLNNMLYLCVSSIIGAIVGSLSFWSLIKFNKIKINK